MSATESLLCAVCQHPRKDHRGVVCGNRGCSCLCFLEMSKESPSLEPLGSWQECIMMAVLDCVAENREGDIHVKTHDGETCHVKVRFVPELGITMPTFGTIKKGQS